jgi:Icc-related predicted phosphoesterase
MRVAAIYDIHGNLPALEAVLEDLRRAGADHVVVGGDVLPGPMPRETLDCLTISPPSPSAFEARAIRKRESSRRMTSCALAPREKSSRSSPRPS